APDAAPEPEPCPGCGRAFPPSDGPVHAYIGASAGCWALYGELLALEYESPALMRWHRFTVDAYTAQHPGVPGRRSTQSVHVHLAALHLMLERDCDEARVRKVLAAMAEGGAFEWLDPPDLSTEAGVETAIAAAGTERYGDTVRAWAQEVWQAWRVHHPAIRAEAEAALTSH
ncbi:MAG TPA: DUF5946 family protein, partial [Allosphingosinicella sp.]|nr:DUF5946 family protein [Allosphingosinicella sp.]